MLKGKVAVVTGGGAGIGAAIAMRFAGAGARVSAWDVAFGADAEKAYAGLGEGAACERVDITEKDEVAAAAGRTLARFGTVDILVNNAGITRDKLVFRMEEEEWDAVLAVNLKGAFLCSKIVGRTMYSRRSGRIVNVASVIGQIGNVGQANYAASKAGLIALTKSCAKEFARAGVCVNAVAPGFIMTRMTERLPEQVRETMLKSIPLGRFGTADEVADVCLFLASDQARYITGQVIRIDGGLVM